jgi:hypothetical protein
MKTIWVEILLISAIILIPISFAVRLIYGREWRQWEYSLIESWGRNPVAYDIIKIIILIGFAGYFFIRQKRKEKNKNRDF